MANRSNRRRLNPVMSTCSKHVKAIGSRRADNPLWPGINVCQLKRPDIRAQSYHVRHQQLACKTRRSPYTVIRQIRSNLRSGVRISPGAPIVLLLGPAVMAGGPNRCAVRLKTECIVFLGPEPTTWSQLQVERIWRSRTLRQKWRRDGFFRYRDHLESHHSACLTLSRNRR